VGADRERHAPDGERVVHGDLSVEEGAAELDHDVDAVLQKRRWLLSRGITP